MIDRLSAKQKQLLRWCHAPATRDRYDAVICDGAVRSGKTVIMSISFLLWAMRRFNNCSFAICGKTQSSVERNIVMPLLSLPEITGRYSLDYKRSLGCFILSRGNCTNRFYLFGGRDESSYSLIQGVTLCGVMFDEVALMPRSFVEQAIARTLSVSDSKLWFNCNPESPSHWFYREWILNAQRHRALYLHFTMHDNPILTDADIEKAESMYEGVFRRRYIEGLWVAAEGLVYPMFGQQNLSDFCGENQDECYVSVDYGTVNPCSMGLWCVRGGTAYRIDEYYHSSKQTHRQLTDEEYYSALLRLCENKSIISVIVDPSAASFIETIRRHARFSVIPAKNNVADGIRFTSTLLRAEKIKINPRCKGIIEEFSMYLWDTECGEDCVIKRFDHAMDDMRYFCYTVLRRLPAFSGATVTSVRQYGELSQRKDNGQCYTI